MNVPTVWWIRNLIECARSNQQSTPWGTYVPARPEGFHGICLRARLHAAWKVFTGEYDAVNWSPPRQKSHS